ncbi:hypothetical protein POTOM_021702 [Populus tomentosa]|uniref:Uncharacterized protein n=1 Tax=Populus tomentosa TaxID=118781 RepID=A0A8X8D3A8_POPTO|nr:hypothetical protein POTOM_021702 [Populus tomentosa]
MAEETQHQGVFHHHNSEEKPVEAGYDAPPPLVPDVDHSKEEKHHKNLEHVGELRTAGASAFVMNEKHESKKDPEHAHRHKTEEETAAAGPGGFVFHEHHEKKETKKEEEEAHGKKNHHF